MLEDKACNIIPRLKHLGGRGEVGVSTPGDTEHGHEKNSGSNSLGLIQIPLPPHTPDTSLPSQQEHGPYKDTQSVGL